MTLRDLFHQADNHPIWLIYYFCAIPIVCFLLFILVKDSNKAYRIKWIFSVLCFSVVLPGIFSLTLNLYLFLFERQSIWDFNLISQVLPIASMLLSLYLIRKIIAFDYIPGFEKLSTISTIIFGMMGLFWILDRTHIFAFSMIPFSFILIGFAVLLLVVKFILPKLF
ncbi:MAG: hypothetical protein V4683_14215 [Bacteroidota bacterium]